MPAVIFDIDGVLVDSYHAHFRSWRDVAAERGHRITEAQFAETFGRTSRDIIRHRWDDGLDDAAVEELARRKEERFRELIASDYPAMDGAAELIARLREAGFVLALGSSGPPENVELTLSHFGRGVFFAVVTGADVARGKPDPQVFELAAARLGVEAASCAVIEDAPAGISAARAAAMTSIALVSTGRRASDFEDVAPDLVVGSLRELTAPRIRAML